MQQSGSREKQSRMCICISGEREMYFKEWSPVTVGAGKLKFSRRGWQAADPGRLDVAQVWRQNPETRVWAFLSLSPWLVNLPVSSLCACLFPQFPLLIRTQSLQ